jgi:TPR repeat protein
MSRLTPAAAAELRQQLEARAEAGDADAQFKLGVLHCFGTGGGASGGGGCGNHKQAAEDDSPVIDKDSLDFLIGPGTACN